MTRIRQAAACSRIAAILWLGAAGWLCAPAPAQEGPVVARATAVDGRVLISSGGAPAIALTRGYVLNPGDTVDTRGGGRLVIDLSDGSMVVVQPGTLLTLKDYRQAGSLRELFQITLGRVRVRINHFAGRPNPYRMNSPTASIAVRGTEFTIAVGNDGATEVAVIEGAVEVTSLADPSRRMLIEAGRAVLVRTGQDFRLYAPGRDNSERGGDRGDAGGPDRRESGQRASEARPGSSDPRSAGSTPGAIPGHGDHDEPSPRSAAGTYERYIAGLSEIGQVPFLLRFNAFPEAHLDSLENPAFAGQFRSGEARLFVLPTFSGLGSFSENTAAFDTGGNEPATYSISPQFSIFVPLPGQRWVMGGSATASRIDSGVQGIAAEVGGFGADHGLLAAALNTTGSTRSRYFSGSLLAARRLTPDTSLGFEVERLNGSGTLWHERVDVDPDGTLIDRTDAKSSIAQTRLTAGLQHSFGGRHNLGLFYRYGFIDAHDADISHTLQSLNVPLESTATAGHSSELGMRLRGPLSRRFFYGVQASWLGLSLHEGLVRLYTADSTQRNRARRATLGLGLGYLLGERTVLSFDLSGGTSLASIARSETSSGLLLQTGNGDSRFISGHAAVQSEVWRRLFVTASILAVSQAHHRSFSLFPDSSGSVSPVQSSFLPLVPTPASNRSSDFGAGWRFTPNLFAQYVYSTDYGASSPSHTVMLRYTFHLRKQ